jgi:hypothetical protein
MDTKDVREKVKWLQTPEMLGFLKAYFTDQRPEVDMTIVEPGREIAWMAAAPRGERPKLIDTPFEFFLNAQIHASQDPETLIEHICATLTDLCTSWRLVDNPKHYITLRKPQTVILAPSGSIQLTIVASSFTETLGRELFLKA